MIELRNIHKHFGQVKALQGVTLKVSAGSIHGVVGENGAGKTTLMKVLTGYIHRTSGAIIFNNNKIHLRTPRDAMQLGIGMLYQEPLDFLQLSVLDNFMAGMEKFKPETMKKTLAALCAKFGFILDPESPINRLTVGERQQLELMRLIHSGTKVLILDEPTTGISDEQQTLLFSALTSLRDEGCAIILVSHKLSEVDTLCDEVSVLRQGMIASHQKSPFNRDQLLQAMFDTLPEHGNSPEIHPGTKEILSFKNINSSLGRSGLKDITLSIYEGEVVGLAGLDGSGQDAFLRLAGDLHEPESGQLIRFVGDAPPRVQTTINSTVFLPADRLNEGLIPGLTIREHMLLATDTPLFIAPETGRDKAKSAITKFNILGKPESFADGLSGGNQQRLLLSLMPPDARLILMENPTRGLDVQSGTWTWQHLFGQLPDNGALIFASPDLEEIMEYAARVLVFFDGRIILDKPTRKASFDEVSRAITGQVEATA
jgi:simple sugar transport system ATP-binding protein